MGFLTELPRAVLFRSSGGLRALRRGRYDYELLTTPPGWQTNALRFFRRAGSGLRRTRVQEDAREVARKGGANPETHHTGPTLTCFLQIVFVCAVQASWGFTVGTCTSGPTLQNLRSCRVSRLSPGPNYGRTKPLGQRTHTDRAWAKRAALRFYDVSILQPPQGSPSCTRGTVAGNRRRPRGAGRLQLYELTRPNPLRQAAPSKHRRCARLDS